MYRRPKFLEALLDIRREMASEAEHDVHLLAEMARVGCRSKKPAIMTICKDEASRSHAESNAEPVPADTLTPSL
ncbi:MAG: hypothetical protein KBD94_05950 [Pyrinomonadaceae bacterium]|nr:hypothetical protein [Pyrinomonadaceae bacterium]